MSRLRIYEDHDGGRALAEHADYPGMRDALARIGVGYERWDASAPIVPGDPPEKVIAAYRADIDRLMAEHGYQSVDVISLSPEHPDKVALRKKFLEEHTHSEDEVRFFVAGSGMFTLHVEGKVYEVLCEQGDLIRVPDGTRHWFDMGPNPSFVAIRIFTNTEGWVANFTGDVIASRFPRLEN
jgi:1,2-dihydroxy-3-keto-5-methylthiopentene dioxygenase